MGGGCWKDWAALEGAGRARGQAGDSAEWKQRDQLGGDGSVSRRDDGGLRWGSRILRKRSDSGQFGESQGSLTAGREREAEGTGVSGEVRSGSC